MHQQIRKIFLSSILILAVAYTVVPQSESKAELIDAFGRQYNDELLARVDNLWVHLQKDGKRGVVILYGSGLSRYINQRRIEGCNLMRRYPDNGLTFVFGENQQAYDVEFWTVPISDNSTRFAATVPDFKLDDLKKAVELSVSWGTDEFCPRHFDLRWYSRFLVANPKMSGCVVINVRSDRTFRNRVSKHRKELSELGVSQKRIKYIRRKFNGEQDEQFWLVPGGK